MLNLPIDPPDLDKYLTLEECAHQAWKWAYDVVQLQSEDEENLTFEEHHQAHRLTIRLLMDYMWTSLGVTPDQEAEESLIELLQVGWLRYARENVISRTHTLERSGIIDTIDANLKLATRGTLYQEDEVPLTTDDAEDDPDPDEELDDTPPLDEFDDERHSHGENGL